MAECFEQTFQTDTGDNTKRSDAAQLVLVSVICFSLCFYLVQFLQQTQRVPVHLIETSLLQFCFESMFHRRKSVCQTFDLQSAAGLRRASLFFFGTFSARKEIQFEKLIAFNEKYNFFRRIFVCWLIHSFACQVNLNGLYTYICDPICVPCTKCVYRYSRVRIAVMVGWLADWRSFCYFGIIIKRGDT